MHQEIAGKDQSTSREIREAERAIDTETRELEEIARRVIAEHARGQDAQ